MSEKDLLGKAIARYLTKNFVKWFSIGFGAALILGTVIGVSFYYGFNPLTDHDPDPDIPFSTRLAEEIASEIPNVVHVIITGNATQAIHERLSWAIIDQEGDNTSYSWNVTAYVMFPADAINFLLSTAEVNEIGTGLVTSITNTERVGTFGVAPYGEDPEPPNMKWSTELYLANYTVILLFIDMEGLILFQTSTWQGDYNIDDTDMQGSAVLLPESAFDDYIQVLKDLFTPHLQI